jgi:hypothetical protein
MYVRIQLPLELKRKFSFSHFLENYLITTILDQKVQLLKSLNKRELYTT